MGLGLLGGALNDAIFLAGCGAELTITDLKSKSELAPSLKKLSKFKNIKYVLGRHDLEDFKKADLILQPGNVPIDSIYLAEAKKNNIPIHESESLFMEYAEDIKVVGVTGTRGKTTTTCLIYEILKSVFGRKVHLGGNVKGKSTLSLLKDIREGDLVVLELDSWCLHGFGDIGKSPQISVFTNLMSDHLNYYLKGSKDEKEAEQKYFSDKSQIYLNQKKGDFLICGEKIAKRIGKTRSHPSEIKNQFHGARKIIAKKTDIPKDWKLKIKGEHNLENISYAVKVAEILGVPMSEIKKAVETFSGVEGRQEFLREYKGIKIYNDTTATTPDATIVALKALSDSRIKIQDSGIIGKNHESIIMNPESKGIILIMGGADKNLDMSELIKEVPKYCKKVILLAGTGTEKLGGKIDGVEVKSLKEGLLEALKWAKKGDILLLSPAFASFGMFKNEFDRGDQFTALIKALK